MAIGCWPENQKYGMATNSMWVNPAAIGSNFTLQASPYDSISIANQLEERPHLGQPLSTLLLEREHNGRVWVMLCV